MLRNLLNGRLKNWQYNIANTSTNIPEFFQIFWKTRTVKKLNVDINDFIHRNTEKKTSSSDKEISFLLANNLKRFNNSYNYWYFEIKKLFPFSRKYLWYVSYKFVILLWWSFYIYQRLKYFFKPDFHYLHIQAINLFVS